ncbi:cytochrome c biogenesis protein CcmG, thiol:disulfide interchange protein DsbE [Vreelandella subterranea]|uniref:Cytochrome c biogenesis protein CcmG, thiol:disulfide interchange protein DsbE n=1 Tax=Vreelandella subterranea TaxID=416874 RepID=A0A1H9WAD5_9GAMM|nr:DsbE family thiol:disulfide interchange protein [Halomonas subterranea]SES30795.1 cytochrome c biogenesis protein CcmG, thiol:disulfide interchange protein DsbE [Halomonas subterranea]
MKRRWLLFLLPVAFLGLALFFFERLSQDPADRDSALMARDFPAFEATTLADENQRVDQSLLKGQLTLVNVWGEWCAACRQEMPQLLDLADRGIRLVGVNYRDTRENGLAFLNEFGDPFAANIFDPEGDLGFELGVIGAPETFVVDAQGIIRYHHKGYVSPEDVRNRLLPEVEKWR